MKAEYKGFPEKINWVYDVCSKQLSDFMSNHSYREVLILTHRHSACYWEILFGWILKVPDDFYTFMAKPCGINKNDSGVEIPTDKIIAIGIINMVGNIEYQGEDRS
jgi:hypothetical protein